MLKNYLLVSFRNLLKHKLLSAINIAGLSIGLSAVLLISLYIWDELTFDSYLSQSGQIHKIELQTNFPGRGLSRNPFTAGALAPGLLSEYPDLVSASVRTLRSESTVTIQNVAVSQTVYFADSSFFDFFRLEYLEGSAMTAQPDRSTVALSKRAAERYFGDSVAVGRTLRLDDGNDYRVGAVFRDFPENTHMRPELIFPLKPSDRDLVANDEGWWAVGFNSYVKLQDGVSIEQFSAVLSEFVDRYLEGPSPDVVMSSQYSFNVMALDDVHFETASADAGNPLMLQGFAAIAFVILSIATFNFMNMSITRATVRVKEVAVRKVFGAGRRNIVSLLMNETILTVLVSLLLAVVITEVSLIWFNDFVAKLMDLGTLATPRFAMGLVALVLLVSVGAGFYPAKIMADFRPATVLRGGRSASKNVSRLGRILVTAQFAVAIGLMITATVIYQQINYSQSMDPGYQRENLLLVQGLSHPDVRATQTLLRDRIAALPDVTDVALVDQAPGGRYGWMDTIDAIDGVVQPQPIVIRGVSVDDGFLDTFGIRLVAGRPLTTERAEDVNHASGSRDARETYNILINQQALATMGLGSAEEAIGKTLGQGGTRTIVGVVQDYVWGTSKGTVPAAMYVMDQNVYRHLAVRFKTDDVAALTKAIDAEWSGLISARPIRRQFMDDRIANLYRQEQQQGELFALFAGLSILVSCIGLYGLASFTVAGRTKEIGVRKILGASTLAVARRILWDFSKPVLLANLIAWPAAGYIARQWLSDFTYAIELDILPFMGAAILALVLAVFTVGGQALKVAGANPAMALRSD